MKLDIGSFMFNINVENGGGTCSWGTALGQNKEYKFDTDKVNNAFFSAMLYNKVSDSLVECKLGKGGFSEQYEIIISSLFEKIYVNDILIPEAKFLLFIVKEFTQSHKGRKTLKYNQAAIYNKEKVNEDCILKIRNEFNLNADSAWIVTDFFFVNQDELHLKAYFLSEKKLDFNSSAARKKWLLSEIDKMEEIKKENILNYLSDEFQKIQSIIQNEWDSYRFFGVKYFNYLSRDILKDFVNKIGVKDSAIIEFQKGVDIGGYLENIDYPSANNCRDGTELNSFNSFEIQGHATNLIVFGTPGCGKSYYVENELLKDFNKDNIFRTTFYQDYTNTDFVGQILPYVEKNEEGKEKRVTYKFNPGPFALALKQAVLHKDEKVALVVEELNRGNAPAIFGDVFQLLDRDENGISRYSITNINLSDYLNRELNANFGKIKIPGNLYIYATMNTSDQNVFTLDTAFKRRWDSLKLKNTFDTYIDVLGYEHKHDYKLYKIPGMKDVTWQQFVNEINNAIVGKEGERDNINVSDKQIGVYFIDKNGLYQENIDANNLNDRTKAEKFAYKVFSYLWDDVAKFDKDKLFAKEVITLDELIEKYIKYEIIFNPSLHEKLYPTINQKDSDSSETE